jgi:RimJ/RimL family protein N-acetyltransferase
MNLKPVTLTGNLVRLEPLGEIHAPDLLIAAAHDEIWNYLDEPTPRTTEDILALIAEALKEQEEGVRLPFAIVDNRSGQVVGSTSYIDIRPKDRGVELGWAWLTPSRWGHGLTTEGAYLMLRHAFEEQDVIRVAMKADVRNVRSQRAMSAMGATQEGVFRKHRILSNGYQRDSVYYSIIDSEWPVIRERFSKRDWLDNATVTRHNATVQSRNGS